MKRFFFFTAVNILILSMIAFVVQAFGLNIYLEEGGYNLTFLLIFSALFGFGGAFISLAISKWMAKKFFGVKIIDLKTQQSPEVMALVNKVHEYSRAAGLTTMPEVGVYDSEEVNAFATGPSRKNSLVALSTGLLHKMDSDAVDGVIAHEVAHIANGDMVTMTLLQGVINTFVIFLARIAAFFVGRLINENLGWIIQFALIIVFQIAFSILGSLVVMAYSRHREFHADAGGAKLAGKDKMIGALEGLQRNVDMVEKNQPAIQTMKISGGKPGWFKYWSSHPPMEERIAKLRSS